VAQPCGIGTITGRFPSDLASMPVTVYIHPMWQMTPEALLIRIPAWKPNSP
jgi:hypothetical protein